MTRPIRRTIEGGADGTAATLAALGAVRRLAAASPADRLQVLRDMPPQHRRFVDEFWPAWAHDGQVEPPGDWRVWLIRAGRGFGKTRAGAEWVGEDARGLRVAGTLTDAAAARLVRGGALAGLSVGYRALAARQGARRELTRVELVEVSLVAIPIQPLARIDQVSSEEETHG